MGCLVHPFRDLRPVVRIQFHGQQCTNRVVAS
jgi:hypothetical protein